MRDLVLEDDPILRKRAVPFDFDNPQEDPEKLKEELLDAMVKYEGMGISACQIGVDLKVFAMRFSNFPLACTKCNCHCDQSTKYHVIALRYINLGPD